MSQVSKVAEETNSLLGEAVAEVTRRALGPDLEKFRNELTKVANGLVERVDEIDEQIDIINQNADKLHADASSVHAVLGKERETMMNVLRKIEAAQRKTRNLVRWLVVLNFILLSVMAFMALRAFC